MYFRFSAVSAEFNDLEVKLTDFGAPVKLTTHARSHTHIAATTIQSRWKDPRTVWSGEGYRMFRGLMMLRMGFSGRVQMYDGCCSVR